VSLVPEFGVTTYRDDIDLIHRDWANAGQWALALFAR
jgi:hypothetical protein